MERAVQSRAVMTAIQELWHSGFQPALVLSVGYIACMHGLCITVDIAITIIIHCHY